jgi:H+/gluconate symporter-like permease
MSAMPGTPAIQNTIPMPFFGTTPFAAPGLGVIAAAIMLGFGLWWLGRAEASARVSGENYGGDTEPGTGTATDDQFIRERATSSHEFDTAEIPHGKRGDVPPLIGIAIVPLLVVVGVNLIMSLVILPRLDFSFLAQERWGNTSLAGVAGLWSVAVALAAATATLIALNRARLPHLRASMDAGANASVLPIFSVASLVGFGAVVAALPAFALVRDWVLSISGGPLVSLAIATNVLAP